MGTHILERPETQSSGSGAVFVISSLMRIWFAGACTILAGGLVYAFSVLKGNHIFWSLMAMLLVEFLWRVLCEVAGSLVSIQARLQGIETRLAARRD